MTDASASRPSPRSRILIPLYGLLAAVAGGLIGELLRHELIEPVERAVACTADPGLWWCPLRDGIRIASQYFIMAGIALLLAGIAVLRRGRAAAAAAIAALFLGGAGLYLYSAGLSAIAVVLALLRAATLDRS